MMNAIVQFIRNAACCVKDLGWLKAEMPFLWDESNTVRYLTKPFGLNFDLSEHEPLNKTTPLEVFISIWQFYAFATLSWSGFQMLKNHFGKVRRIQQLIELRDSSSKKDADKCINASLIKEATRSLRDMFIGWMVMFIGLAFFWLFANSWHVTETDWIGGLPALIHALIVMEIGLLPILYYFHVDGSEQFDKAVRMEALAKLLLEKNNGLAKDTALSSIELLSDGEPFWNSTVSPFNNADPSEQAKQMKAEQATFQAVIDTFVESSGNDKDGEKESKIRADKAAELLDAVLVTRLAGWREYVYLVLNTVAFYGYGLCILVYYFPESGVDSKDNIVPIQQPQWVERLKFGLSDADADWNGNFAGDFMWTVEPMVILASPILFHWIQRRQRSPAKQNAEGKEKKE